MGDTVFMVYMVHGAKILCFRRDTQHFVALQVVGREVAARIQPRPLDGAGVTLVERSEE